MAWSLEFPTADFFRVHSENTVTVTALPLKIFSVNPKNISLVVANFSGQTTEK